MATKKAKAEDVRIVILQRGWVMVGRYEAGTTECVLSDAQVIRRWGTQRGLGQLAAEGPQSQTVLDPAGEVRFHPLTVVATLRAEASKWPR